MNAAQPMNHPVAPPNGKANDGSGLGRLMKRNKVKAQPQSPDGVTPTHTPEPDNTLFGLGLSLEDRSTAGVQEVPRRSVFDDEIDPNVHDEIPRTRGVPPSTAGHEWSAIAAAENALNSIDGQIDLSKYWCAPDNTLLDLTKEALRLCKKARAAAGVKGDSNG